MNYTAWHLYGPERILTSHPITATMERSWSGQRYGHYMELDASKAYLEEAGFEVIKHYYRPSGKPRTDQPWLAIVSRRLERN